MTDVQCRRVDYTDVDQGSTLVSLLNAYAMDPAGGGSALREEVQATLASKLAEIPYAFSFIAYVGDEAAGLINCFEAFSTFNAKPLVNIHDVIVLPEFRGKGVSQAMLEAVEAEARQRGCCKLTLEVLTKNDIAINAYKKFGFGSYELDPEMGVAMFLDKKLI